MKKIAIAAYALLCAGQVFAQSKEGKVTYERVVQVQLRYAGNNEEMDRQVPQTRTDKFELIFGNNQSLWKAAEEDADDNDNINNGGMQIHMVIAGSDDVLYDNFDTHKSVELRELFDKKFIVDDSLRSLKWKMSEETKTILNHLCRKAIAVNYSKRTTMNIDNGKVERKEIDDTSNITAWFTTDFPVSAGPAEYQGQLPGLILAMDINSGRQVFKAIAIDEKPDLAAIKAPQGKKHYTPEEFRKERDKMMDEMSKNNGGGNRVIRVN
jgi:GLPGLI family protein